MTRIYSIFLLLFSFLLLTGCQFLPLQTPSQAAFTRSEPAVNLWQRLEAEQHWVAFQQQNLTAYIHQQQARASASDWRDWAQAQLPEYNLWDRLRANFKMDLSSNDPRVLAEISWYQRHPAYLDRVVNRASRYLFHIVESLEERDLPGELALLPVIESAYDPFAYSHGRASGMWQFVPGTARYLGLDNNWWYDGRRDIIAATDAALTYLDRHYQRFGDWHLAMAAYNGGGGNVNRALRLNREAGGDGSFWNLRHLPAETQAYVPKLIALARVIADPEAVGISLNSVPNEPYFAVVDTRGQIDLALAAELADITLDELYLLNPGFSQWATSPEGPHRLLVPVDKADRLDQALAELPLQQRMSWQRYRVRPGDSLLSISQRFNTTPSMIREVNQLRGDIIRAGHEMLIPIPSRDAQRYALSEDQRLQRNQNRQRNGERVEHLVRSGDSFWRLAQTHGVSVRELASWNNMAPADPLIPGQKLVIWSRSSNAGNMATNTSRSVIRRVNYTVRSGDNLAAIASRFRVTVSDITRWNNLNPNRYLQPGQNLTLHVDVTRH